MLILQSRKLGNQEFKECYASNETDSNEWKGTKIKYGYVPKSRTRCFNGFYLGFQESNQSRTRASFYEGLLSTHCSHEHLTQNTILLDDQDRTSISNVRSQKKSSQHHSFYPCFLCPKRYEFPSEFIVLSNHLHRSAMTGHPNTKLLKTTSILPSYCSTLTSSCK